MGLAWVRLDTNIASHDKILDLIGRRNGRAVAFSYICCLAYSGQNETDGRIPRAALGFVHATKSEMDLLVSVGLLEPTPSGWQITNYGERQQLRAATVDIRAAQSVGGAKGNCMRHHGPDCGCWRKKPSK